MNRDDIQKLLGGYATGTLTPEEQEALFDAALSDQELFDALAREQALRDLLRDPVSKAQLLAALDEPPTRWYDKLFGAWRPIAMGMAMAAVTTVAVVAVWQNRKPQPTIVSQATLPPASPMSSPTVSEDKAAAARDSVAPKPQLAEADSPKRAANEAPVKPADRPQSLADESRRAKAGEPAATAKFKDLAGAVGGARPTFGDQAAPATPPARIDRISPVQKEEQAPLPLVPTPSSMGFRAGLGGAGGGGGRGGRGGRASESDAKLRGEIGSTNGGVIGGIVGGAPGTPPPSVAAPKAEAAPSQIAKSGPVQSQPEPFAKQSQATSQQIAGYPSQQGQQGAQQQPQFGQQSSGQVDQLRQARLQTPPQETVQVTASASSLEARSDRDARALYYGSAETAANKPIALDGASASTTTGTAARKKVAEAPQTKSQPRPMGNMIAASIRPAVLQPRNPGVRYSLLRKTASGELEAIDPQSARPGDTLELQLTPNHTGVLTVSARSGSGDSRVLLIRNVEAMQAYATPTLLATDQELRVTLIPTSAGANNLKRDENAAAELAQQSTAERATYVVAKPSSPKLEFVITLNHK